MANGLVQVWFTMGSNPPESTRVWFTGCWLRGVGMDLLVDRLRKGPLPGASVETVTARAACTWEGLCKVSYKSPGPGAHWSGTSHESWPHSVSQSEILAASPSFLGARWKGVREGAGRTEHGFFSGLSHKHRLCEDGAPVTETVKGSRNKSSCTVWHLPSCQVSRPGIGHVWPLRPPRGNRRVCEGSRASEQIRPRRALAKSEGKDSCIWCFFLSSTFWVSFHSAKLLLFKKWLDYV